MSDDPNYAEAEPAPRRRAHYPGDQRSIMGEMQWLGPDRRGFLWRPCHAEYDAGTDQTLVIFAPVSDWEIGRVPGLREKLMQVQQMQATAAGAVSRLGA